MTRSAVSLRFLVLLLLLSFLFFNIACLPNFLNVDTSPSSAAAQPDRVDSSNPISLIIHGNLDCLEAENVAYRIGFNQNILARKQSSHSFIALFAALLAVILDISYLFPKYNKLFVQLCSSKITIFMRTKDGMV
ncbi:MAG: hypothetical protein CVU91_01370 [Firmicutes bacterium HGW-Firmicutes-16]|nr:MAG: hypothetical protein CVU91_01370 [Firmicutes bacterium HGW-Firmicutes-16]